MYLLTKYIKSALWGVAVRLSYPIYRMRGAYLGSIGTSVLYVGCMVPIFGVAVRLSYI